LRQEAVADAIRPPLILGAVGGLLAVGLSTLAAGRMVARIRALNIRTQSIAGGDFAPGPVPHPDDELTDLARAVNEMARKLSEYREKLTEGERLRVIGQFAGGLAHQIRNAATGAKLALDVFERESLPADPEPLTVARRQLVRIERAVKQFLDLGRPSPGGKIDVDLRTVVRDVADLAAPACKHHDITFDVSIPNEPAHLRGDPDALSHVVTNLIGNAIDAAGPGGTVAVALLLHPEQFELTVADTGPGPSPEVAERLFDPFVTGKPEGIGLGLAVVKQAVTVHGGSITWDRCDGRTVFRVLLPRE
jgi:signal transduction histidine kinase